MFVSVGQLLQLGSEQPRAMVSSTEINISLFVVLLLSISLKYIQIKF